MERLGADSSVNGHDADDRRAVKDFAPEGLDAALAFTNSEDLAETMKQVKKGGRIAYPNEVEPEPKGLPGVEVQAYDDLPSQRLLSVSTV